MGLIRFLLAITIIHGHIYGIWGFESFHLVSSPIAFQSFFLISGFYISFALNTKYVGERFQYKNFLWNRFFRIYPAYWTMLFATVGISLLSYLTIGDALVLEPIIQHISELGIDTLLYTAITNITLIGQEWMFFLGVDPQGSMFFSDDFLKVVAAPDPVVHHLMLISQAWAISFMMLFYAIAPYIVRRKMGVIIGLLLLSLVLRMGFVYMGKGLEPWKYRFFPFEFGMFMLGALSYKLYERWQTVQIRTSYLWGIFWGFILLSCFYDSIGRWFMQNHPISNWGSVFPNLNPIYMISQWIYYGLLVCLMPFFFDLTKNLKWDQFLANISFPVFISHFVLIHLCGKLIPLRNYAFVLIVLLIVCLFSYALLKGLIIPLEKYRKENYTLN